MLIHLICPLKSTYFDIMLFYNLITSLLLGVVLSLHLLTVILSFNLLIIFDLKLSLTNK